MCKSIADRWDRDERYRVNIEETVLKYFEHPGTRADAAAMDEVARRVNEQLKAHSPKTIRGDVHDKIFT